MGKHVIIAVDGPGFLVNRCNRPFSLEALKLLQERIAPLEEIDRICRMGGGFRMGPFELMDPFVFDVGLDVSRSFFEQSFGEPRWRPSPITVRTVAAGRLGASQGAGLLRVPDFIRPATPTHSAARPRVPSGRSNGLVVDTRPLCRSRTSSRNTAQDGGSGRGGCQRRPRERGPRS